jgi:hypothetical protein
MCPSDWEFKEPEKPVAAWEIFCRCWRCNGPIDGESVFAVRLWADKHGVLAYDVERARDLDRDDVAVHMGGDRKCGKPISGYHGKILEKFDLPMSTDTEFLERV